MSTALIAYHVNCIDGFTAAWIVCRAMEKKGYKCDLIAMDYTEVHTQILFDKISSFHYDKLYVVDFSLDIEALVQLEEFREEFNCLEVTILDHHKTAFEMYNPGAEITPRSYLNTIIHGANILLDNSRSGAGIAWEYFNHSPVCDNNLITYVQDWDLWRFVHGDDTRFMHHYLLHQEKVLACWDALNDAATSDESLCVMLDVGEMKKEKHDRIVETIAGGAVNVIIAGEMGLAVGCSREIVSDVGNLLAEKSGTYGAMYTVDLSSNKIYWSFRSVGDYDVEILAKKLGGGGHMRAARAMLDFLPTTELEDICNNLAQVAVKIDERETEEGIIE